jgi:hypothetical protein
MRWAFRNRCGIVTVQGLPPAHRSAASALLTTRGEDEPGARRHAA